MVSRKTYLFANAISNTALSAYRFGVFGRLVRIHGEHDVVAIQHVRVFLLRLVRIPPLTRADPSSNTHKRSSSGNDGRGRRYYRYGGGTVTARTESRVGLVPEDGLVRLGG